MPHPIYGDPNHKLEQVTFTLTLPEATNGHLTTITAAGRSSTCRTALWTMEQSWQRDEQAHGYQPGDALSHIVMVAMQDRPTGQRQVDACMVGEGWAQDELPM